MAGENANLSDKNVSKFWILWLGVISVVYFVMVLSEKSFFSLYLVFFGHFVDVQENVLAFSGHFDFPYKIFWRFWLFSVVLSLKCVQKGVAACPGVCNCNDGIEPRFCFTFLMFSSGLIEIKMSQNSQCTPVRPPWRCNGSVRPNRRTLPRGTNHTQPYPTLTNKAYWRVM